MPSFEFISLSKSLAFLYSLGRLIDSKKLPRACEGVVSDVPRSFSRACLHVIDKRTRASLKFCLESVRELLAVLSLVSCLKIYNTSSEDVRPGQMLN